jgi:hypothetical protein
MIADSTSKFVGGTPGTFTSSVILNGIAPQYLKGTTTEEPPFTYTSLRINKGGLSTTFVDDPSADPNGLVYMERNVTIATSAVTSPSSLILANGILNLGKDTLRVGANYITRYNGAIDGASGTYVIIPGHQTPYLEDPFFAVGGSPTLFNLDVTADHQARNNLTVNGDMNLNGGNFMLAPVGVPDLVEPKTLTI